MARIAFLIFVVLVLAACGGGNGDGSGRGDRAGPAPDEPATEAEEAVFDDLLADRTLVLTSVGASVFKATFTEPGRFFSFDDPNFPGEYPGNYTYEDIDSDTATMTFTWDPNNDPDEAHLVVELTFTSDDAGTYNSIYTEEGADAAPGRGDFELIETSELEERGTEEEAVFDDLLADRTLVLTSVGESVFKATFTEPGRFFSFDDPNFPGEYPGDYTYEDIDSDTARMTFTWDPNNDPDEAYLVIELTFTSDDTGTYSSIYTEEGADAAPGTGDFELIETSEI